jgi:hypothetical protein
LTTRAKIEAEQADDARKIAEHESTLALRGVQTKQAEAGIARANRPAPPLPPLSGGPGTVYRDRNDPATILAENPPLPPRPATPRPYPVGRPGTEILDPNDPSKVLHTTPPLPPRQPAVGKTTVADKKFDISQAANQAISEHPELDLSIIKENVMNPRYFTDWEPQKRADVSLEIQRRIDAKKTPKTGGTSQERLAAAVEAGTFEAGTLFGPKKATGPAGAGPKATPEPAATGKTFPRSRLGEYANANSMSVPQAEAALAKLGYTIN